LGVVRDGKERKERGGKRKRKEREEEREGENEESIMIMEKRQTRCKRF